MYHGFAVEQKWNTWLVLMTKSCL